MKNKKDQAETKMKIMQCPNGMEDIEVILVGSRVIGAEEENQEKHQENPEGEEMNTEDDPNGDFGKLCTGVDKMTKK